MRLGLAALRVGQRRLEDRVTAEVTATRPNNDSPGLTATVAHNKIVASHQVATLN